MRALVLAGEREEGGHFARSFDAACSAFVELSGKRLVDHVLDALARAQSVTSGTVCGPAGPIAEQACFPQHLQKAHGFEWIEQRASPVESVLAALTRYDERPLLVTTADHAMLVPEIIDAFCDAAGVLDADLVVGVVPHHIVSARWPGIHRTRWRFRDGTWCGANLYLVRTADAANGIRYWQSVQQLRKQPWRILARLDIGLLTQTLLKRLTLAAALERLSANAGCRIAHISIDDPRAAVDVDSVQDYQLAAKVLAS